MILSHIEEGISHRCLWKTNPLFTFFVGRFRPEQRQSWRTKGQMTRVARVLGNLGDMFMLLVGKTPT